MRKTIENLISKKITPIFKNILCDSQHGFRTNHFTNIDLMISNQNNLKCISDGHRAYVIYSYVTKAFYRVTTFFYHRI